MKVSPCTFAQTRAFHPTWKPLTLKRIPLRGRRLPFCRADPVQERTPASVEPSKDSPTEEADVEQVTKKWGLEAGLFKVISPSTTRVTQCSHRP